MKKRIINCVVIIASFISCSAFAGFINTLSTNLNNESNYQLDNIEQVKDDKGTLLSIYVSNLAGKTVANLADYRMNLLGQLSQDLSFDLHDSDGKNAGSCNIHIGVGSYVANPDFTGSKCNLSNGDYLQINPTYEIKDNKYYVKYTLTKLKTFSRIIVFGDSMSDNGNLYQRSVELSLIFPISPILPVSPPYYNGRFTNGQVWVELLSKKLNIPEGSLINYAYAGARVQQDYMPIPSLDKQVNKYLNWNRAGDPYALYVVWIGSNDILRGYTRNDEDLLSSISSGIETNIKRLINHGARHILSPQLPDLSLVPDSYDRDQANGNKDYSERLKKLAIKYNQIHKVLLAKLRAEYPDVHIMTFNVYQFLNDAKDKAQEYGFNFIHERCNPNQYWEDELATCMVPMEYVFWDGVHPTAKAHEILSGLMLKLVLNNGYEPNIKPLSKSMVLPDDFVSRNKEAIKELNKEIDNSNRQAFGLELQGLRAVVDGNIQLF